jgi:hypothetical protein
MYKFFILNILNSIYLGGLGCGGSVVICRSTKVGTRAKVFWETLPYGIY